MALSLSQQVFRRGDSARPRIGVLGGTGFIGRHLSEAWRERTAANGSLCLLVHRSRPDWLGSVRAEIIPVDLENGAGLDAGLCGIDQLLVLMRPNGESFA